MVVCGTMASKEELTEGQRGRMRPAKWADVKGCTVRGGGGVARMWRQGEL